MHVGVAKVCNGFMRKFLWVGGEESRKIACVSWSSVCKPKEVGDWELGICLFLISLCLASGDGDF